MLEHSDALQATPAGFDSPTLHVVQRHRVHAWVAQRQRHAAQNGASARSNRAPGTQARHASPISSMGERPSVEREAAGSIPAWGAEEGWPFKSRSFLHPAEADVVSGASLISRRQGVQLSPAGPCLCSSAERAPDYESGGPRFKSSWGHAGSTEEPADVATAPHSRWDERKPWRFDSALLRSHKEGDRPVEGHRWKRCTALFASPGFDSPTFRTCSRATSRSRLTGRAPDS